jgi:hypothetical protein
MKINKSFGVCIYKIRNNNIYILCCKSISSVYKWGFIKGTLKPQEMNKYCAKREFFEESSIDIDIKNFEEYFEQKSKNRHIGIWLLDYDKIDKIDKYFYKNILKRSYLSSENSIIKFFNINKLPLIKDRQSLILKNIVSFLRNIH